MLHLIVEGTVPSVREGYKPVGCGFEGFKELLESCRGLNIYHIHTH